MSKLILKKMNVYVLHRNNVLDHKKGRPAILWKYKSIHCLVWTGTSKIDKFTKEKPIIIKMNGKEGYFYSTGIEKVNTTDLIAAWTDFQTKKAYHLSSDIQKELISKFIELSNQKNPYKENAFLELNNQILKQENQKLESNQEKLKIDNLKLRMNNKILNNENGLLKQQNEKLQKQLQSEYEPE